MRITGGTFRGRKLFPPKDFALRPTSDKVKEALFSILASEIQESRFLDCFAGTGAVGFEAISRRAASVTFIEEDRKAMAIVERNAKNLGVEVERFYGDFFHIADRLSRNHRQFDLIFIDPPYAGEIQVPAVLKIDSSDLLATKGKVIVEHDKRELTPDTIGRFCMTDRRKYGETYLSFYQ